MAKRKKKIGEKPSDVVWASPWTFILAASGAAIGLNNVWQFPVLVSEYGGGAFVVFYLLCVLLIGMPLLIAEITIGRLGRKSPVNSIHVVAEQAGRHRNWRLIGWLGVIAAFLILSYLSVVAGWIMAYAFRSVVGVLDGLTADGLASLFRGFVNEPEKQLFWHSLFMVSTIMVVARGLKSGVEPLVRYAMPTVFLLLLALLLYAIVIGEFNQAVYRLLHPDFTKLTRAGMLAALGHAFFSLGLGAGVLLAYAAYLQKEASISTTALAVAGVDTLVGIVAGLVIMSVLLVGVAEPESRLALVFEALPLGFDQLPWGRVMASLFFLMLALTVWLSGVALMEPVVMWMEERWHFSRLKAAIVTGAGAWLLGIASVLSFNYWRFSFTVLGETKNLGPFDLLQTLTADLLLPMSGMLSALTAGWVLGADSSRTELKLHSPCAYDSWLWCVRVVTPALILIVLVNVQSLFL